MNASDRAALRSQRRLGPLLRWLRPHWRLFLEAVRLAFRVEIGLRVLPFKRILARLNGQTKDLHRRGSPVSPASAWRAIQLAYVVLPFKSTCLKHSVIFCRMFKRRGLPAELQIGVNKTGGRLSAHAWVEDGNGMVLTDPLVDFVPLPLPRRRCRDKRTNLSSP
jgi:hypothetical protein